MKYYLIIFGIKVRPNPSEINSEKWIRPKIKESAPIIITIDYMNNGTGRFYYYRTRYWTIKICS
jgi:hypothetical protein